MKTIYLSLVAALFATASLQANNIQVANVSISNQNTSTHQAKINFDVSWNNSWRTSTNESNHDGAWLFVKFRKKGTQSWIHASLDAAGFTAPAGSAVKVSSDGKGLWVYRAANGFGNVNYTGAAVTWNYEGDGVLDSDAVDVTLFAVEMVSVPEGDFYLGSGGTETGRFFEGGTAATPAIGTPYHVTSEGSIEIDNTAGNLYYGDEYSIGYPYYVTSAVGDKGGPLPASFPKGYKSFWVMKHELSQQGYADFLNSITSQQATARNGSAFTGTYPGFVPVQPERAYTNASAADALAFLDWAALRPITELEYEKACRGKNITPYPNEYAWGNDTKTVTSIVSNDGQPNEAPTNGNFNAQAALGRAGRAGMYATSSSNREQSGATYYGALDMAGNATEQTVSVGSPDGRAFTGLNGDGKIAVSGAADTDKWPLTAGMGKRGGGYAAAPSVGAPLYDVYMVSGRFYANTHAGRDPETGIRGGRSAE